MSAQQNDRHTIRHAPTGEFERRELGIPGGVDATSWSCTDASSGIELLRCVVTRNPGLDTATERNGLIGWYRGIDELDAGRSLLESIASVAAAGAYTRLLGPINHDTWHTYRVPLPSDDPPFFLDVPTPEWVADHFRAGGFVPVESYHSTEHSLDGINPERIERFTRHFEERGITIRSIDPVRFDEELERIYMISIEAFADNPLYTPIPLDDVRPLYSPLLPFLDPDFALIAEDREGRPTAFILAVEDRSRPPGQRIVVKTVATRSGRAGTGLGTLLVETVHLRGSQRGYAHAVHALMHDRNPSTRIVGNGRTIRRYILFGRRCDADQVGVNE